MELAVSNLNIVARLKGGARNQIVRNLSFNVASAEKLAIVGHSGCGKTMTAMAVLGLLPENCQASGSILWDGKELLSMTPKERRQLLGREHVLIPQSGADFLNPSLTIRHQMNEALARLGVRVKDRKEEMTRLLERVGFSDSERVLRSYPFQLSGGMAQRVVMAMASAGKPGLVIADEPTKGIDQHNTEQFLENLDELFSDTAVVLITHDISVASACDFILVIKDGELEEYGKTDEVLASPKSKYTHQLICDLPHALSHVDRGLV